MNSHRIKAILADPDFKAFVDQTCARLTGIVMSQSTDEVGRAASLAEYHALKRLVSRMGSEAQNAKEDTDE